MEDATLEIRLLGPDDREVLGQVAPGVFDHPVDASLSAEFLADARHHLAVALEGAPHGAPGGGRVVGMASGVHYLHPDKPPELWINEVGVTPAWRGRGVGKALLGALLAHARTLGCAEAWVLTDEANTAARRLYASLGGEEGEAPVYVTFRLAGERGAS